MAWQFKPLTYDSVDINNATYKSKFVVSDNPLDMINSEPQEVTIPGDYSFPEAVRAQLESGRLYLQVQVASNTQAAIDAARLLFDRMKGAVPVTIQDGGVPTTWTISVRCERLVTIAPTIVVATLYLARPIMESALRTDSLRTISATPTTWSPTPQPIGTVRSYPALDLTATVAKSNANDYTKSWQVVYPWRSEFPGEDSVGGPYPIDVANGTLNTAAEVTATRMQADGDDLRVFVDGVEYRRELSGMNTTTTRVWVGIYFSPGLKATLGVAMASGASPANGGEIEVSDELGLVGWPERGYFTIDNECLFFGDRTTTKLKKIKRGQRGQAAAAHSVGARLDWVEHDIQIVSNWSAAPTPVAATMGISPSSTNLEHSYVAQFASAGVRRPGQMLIRYTPDNVMSPLLSNLETSSGFAISDRVAGGLYSPGNNAELYAPCGVKVAASALQYDCVDDDSASGAAPNGDIVLIGRLYGIDVATGVERLLATHRKSDRGAGKTLTPDTVLQRLRFNAVYAAITGHYNPLTTASAAVLASSTDEWGQRFTLDQATKIEALAVWAKEAAAGDTRTILLSLKYPTSGSGSPEPANTILATADATVLNATLDTAYGWASIAVASGVPITVPASSVYDLVAEQGAGAGTISWGYWRAGYANGSQWDETASTWVENPQFDFGFLLMGDGSVVQPEAPTGMLGAVAWDNIIVTFDDTTPRTPKYLRSAQRDIYIHRGAISSDTTGQSITVFYIAALNELITIDCYRREVILDDTQGIYAPGAVTLSDPEQWLHMIAAANTLRYVETGVGTVTITTKWKDGWA